MTINSWEQFLDVSTKYPVDKINPANVFRGQADSRWRLESSIARIVRNNNYSNNEALSFEKELLSWFISKSQNIEFPLYLPAQVDLLSWLEIMQHYRLPTRLLDWTKSIYVACYFACCDNFDYDGVIYLMDAGHIDWIQSIRRRIDLEEGVKLAQQEVLKSIIGEEYVESFLLISNPKPSIRMLNQKSQLSITTEILEEHDKIADRIVYSKVLNYDGQSIFYKYVIPVQLKKEFLYHLNEIGIDKDFIYPDKDFNEEIMSDYKAFLNKRLIYR